MPVAQRRGSSFHDSEAHSNSQENAGEYGGWGWGRCTFFIPEE